MPARLTSIFLGRPSKSIATLNSIWIFISCMCKLGNFYNRRYCNGSVFWLQDRAFNVIQLVVDDLAGMKVAWMGRCSGLAIQFHYSSYIVPLCNSIPIACYTYPQWQSFL
ncbi:hypothetical protein K443DRAFT_337167 [Laccaria amethystina LaAM-08-1]|uniref:Uncharacterized protein n=1 Tax=Laccaria amethystina LaAM-08-1 TaxID=1095629 RepID=A0A0C9XGA6_9AGAR|nr:hypothetical protein K443DRAFT_337167 [Laccaria amethystina LaAM-08-1]